MIWHARPCLLVLTIWITSAEHLNKNQNVEDKGEIQTTTQTQVLNFENTAYINTPSSVPDLNENIDDFQTEKPILTFETTISPHLPNNYEEFPDLPSHGTTDSKYLLDENLRNLSDTSINITEGSDDLITKEPFISEIRAFVDGQLTRTSSYRQIQEDSESRSVIASPFRNFIGGDSDDINLDKWESENINLKITEEKKISDMFDWKTNYQSRAKLEEPSNEFGTSASNSNLFSKSSFRNVLAEMVVHDQANEPQHISENTAVQLIQQEEGAIKNPIINFHPLPDGEAYEMKNLGLTDGVFLFAYLGDFLSFIQPYDFPAEILRDALWSRLSIVSLIFQSLRVEAGFIICVTIGVLLSLVVPSLAIAASCSSMCVPDKHISDSASINSSRSDNCTRKTLLFVLFVLIIIVGGGVTAMIVTNEQFSSSMLQTPQVMSVALNDLSSYIRNSQRQLSHVTIVAMEKLVSVIFADLDGVEELLGKPIQKQLASDTGVDVALDTLVDVSSVVEGLSKKVAELQETNLKLRELSLEARDRLVDLRAQVEGLRRACPSRDRPLCDTIESFGLEITLRSDLINIDPRLSMLRSMAEGNLPLLASRVKSRFEDIPSNIARVTKDIRDDIKRELQHQRTNLDTAMWPVESLTRDLRSRVNEAREFVGSVEEAVGDLEQWRWLSMLIAPTLLLLIWILFAVAVLYSCCDRDDKSKSLLIGALFTTSLLSLILWTVALALFLVGGHGEVFICRPLYDKPQYKSLTQLFDDPGVIYQRGGGLFKNLLSRNQSLNVPIKAVLEECEENKSVYEAFNLNKILKIESISNFQTWDSVFDNFHNLKTNYSQLDFLDPELQETLQNLLQATGVNMTTLRTQMSKPVTGKDLTSFAKQMDSVANQIKDLATASRVETLASRTRRVITANIQPLEDKKEELVYQIIAIEVQIAPLQRQVNQSLSHLKTIQYYINNQESNIFEMKVVEYTRRLTGYLAQFRGQLLSSLSNAVAPCRPVFEVFHGIRHHMCRQIMDPLNGFWFALVWSMLALIIATPVSLNLIHYYGLQKEMLLDSHSTVSSSGRGAVWTTPGAEDNAEANW